MSPAPYSIGATELPAAQQRRRRLRQYQALVIVVLRLGNTSKGPPTAGTASLPTRSGQHYPRGAALYTRRATSTALDPPNAKELETAYSRFVA
jgi:hypothetical protein